MSVDSLIECVMNVSEGKEPEVIRRISDAIQSTHDCRLLHTSSDPDHHRTVITFVGRGEQVAEGAFAGAAEAIQRIDLRRHRGVHPRIGAVDVVPFVPLGRVTMAEAVRIARKFGARLARELHLPVYFYGEAARSEERINLAHVRRGQFEGLKVSLSIDSGRTPDEGPREIHPSGGAVAVGARNILIAFNLFLATRDVGAAREISRRIRERDGGLPGIKALGLFLAKRGQAQVSVNLTDYRRTSLYELVEAVKREASRLKVEVAGTELIGLVPAEAIEGGELSSLMIENFDESLVLEERIKKLVDIDE